jgi:hypothetical protein
MAPYRGVFINCLAWKSGEAEEFALAKIGDMSPHEASSNGQILAIQEAL